MIPVAQGVGLWMEGRIIDPPSLKGRTVDIHVPATLVDKLLLEFRSSAIAARGKPECDD